MPRDFCCFISMFICLSTQKKKINVVIFYLREECSRGQNLAKMFYLFLRMDISVNLAWIYFRDSKNYLWKESRNSKEKKQVCGDNQFYVFFHFSGKRTFLQRKIIYERFSLFTWEISWKHKELVTDLGTLATHVWKFSVLIWELNS